MHSFILVLLISVWSVYAKSIDTYYSVNTNYSRSPVQPKKYQYIYNYKQIKSSKPVISFNFNTQKWSPMAVPLLPPLKVWSSFRTIPPVEPHYVYWDDLFSEFFNHTEISTAWFLGQVYYHTKETYPYFISPQGAVRFSQYAIDVRLYPESDSIEMVGGEKGVLTVFVYQGVVFVRKVEKRKEMNRVYFKSQFGVWYPAEAVYLKLDNACREAHEKKLLNCETFTELYAKNSL